jgi:formamidopyrimidine-DNA glycosylase
MPELPEVEVVRRGLERCVVKRRIDAVEVAHPRSVRRHTGGPVDFAARLVGSRVVAARRRGKYLWLAMQDGSALLGHLGMSGQLLVRPHDVPPERHLRVRMALDDGSDLRFVDQRTFGGLLVAEGGAELPAQISHIARDPLDPHFDLDEFASRLRKRRTGIKRALLDQALISGVGNIYADEALWLARLHFARATEALRLPDVTGVVTATRSVMTAALEQGGTSFDALYVNVNGESGYFERSLAVYGRAGEPCGRCGTLIRRFRFMNRASYTCPTCQRQPRRPRW